jgi:hypothetical protein
MHVRSLSRSAWLLVVALSTAACSALIVLLIHEGLADASLWAAIVAALAGVIAAGAAVWPLISQSSHNSPPPKMDVPDWVVDRPAEISKVVSALVRNPGQQVAITTGLHGAGGFGKSTLAAMTAADRRVRRRILGNDRS